VTVTIIDGTVEHCHHAGILGSTVCRWCRGWIDYRCTVCGKGGPVEPLWKSGNEWRCWPHRDVQEELWA
jgi:hypothetical protein